MLLAFLVGEVPDPAINRESCGRGEWSATLCLHFGEAPNNSPNPLHVGNHTAVRGVEAKLMLCAADVDHVALLMLPGPDLVSTIHETLRLADDGRLIVTALHTATFLQFSAPAALRP